MFARLGSFLTCGLHWLIWGEWRSICSRAYERDWRLFLAVVGLIFGKTHAARSYWWHRRRM